MKRSKKAFKTKQGAMFEFKGMEPFELHKLGDPLANFIFSVALSKASKRPRGGKVSNRVLSEALKRSGLKGRVSSRSDRGDMGDYVEGLIFKSWSEGVLSIDEAVSVLKKKMGPDSRGKELKEESIEGFKELILLIDKRWKK